MRCLVTGGTGFFGTRLTTILKDRGHDVVSLGSKNADLTIQGSLNNFNDKSYDVIFHLAAWTQAGDFCLHHPGEQWLINQAINTNVLTWWWKSQRQAKLVSIGTSCSYAEGIESLEEEKYLDGKPIAGLFTYGMTKRMLLIGQQSLAQQFDMKYLTFIPSTLYGPGYHTADRQLHFIFDIIRKILEYKYRQTPIVLWGDGYQERDLIYIDDFIEAMLNLVPELNNEILNIGGGEKLTIRKCAETVCKIVGVDPNVIIYDTSKYVGAKSKFLQNTKIDRLVPNRPQTPFEEGLRNSISYLEKELFPNEFLKTTIQQQTK